MKSEYPYLLAGEWLRNGEPLAVVSPFDERPVSSTFRPPDAVLETAVTAAVRAFESTRKLPPHRKYEILSSIAKSLQTRKEELARILALEAGKPLKAARAEVDRATLTFTVGAEEALRLGGEYLPLDRIAATAGRWALVRRFPLGPILTITPFNFPLNLVSHKWSPGMAAGDSIVHKPASKTPVCSLVLAEMALEAGWPAEALTVFPASARQAESWVGDDRLKALSFTGSPEVGWGLKARSGKKRVTLELGGNAGVIVHDDADLEYAAERCVWGGFGYAGQSCISVQRIFIQKRVYDAFVERLLQRVRALCCGDPLNEATDVGPMITQTEAVRAEAWIAEAVQGGARLLTGGGRSGSVLEPTVLAGTSPAMRVNRLEVFAPVVTVSSYDRFGEAIDAVNDSAYGLQAGVFTRDLGNVLDAYERLEVGGVIVGDVSSFRIDHMPYGGVKDSGMGREGIRYAIEELSEMKLLAVRSPGESRS